ncbi:hypothetical protein FEM48_Zijuj07G0117000 [Ziziphus jujuba var. spinosa]|uniref:Zinc knuckle CX2CX4HX4C domain-containing protein n=1 Tax=Ziziphus jujuba var. spinosa TaxID=714518 RepID=A0A978V4F4_ZIZJJ|nr:hypothetical protein FEM48_Zijuj07G0117000 [Ziziphus jujuba var. spinosa]
MQKIGHGKIWTKFCYERLAEFCYNCGVIGHGNAACAHPTLHNQLSDGYLYGPWIHAEADAYSIVVEASGFIGESTQWGRRSNDSKLIGFNLEVTSQSEPLIPRHMEEGDGVSIQHQSSSIRGPRAYYI